MRAFSQRLYTVLSGITRNSRERDDPVSPEIYTTVSEILDSGGIIPSLVFGIIRIWYSPGVRVFVEILKVSRDTVQERTTVSRETGISTFSRRRSSIFTDENVREITS